MTPIDPLKESAEAHNDWHGRIVAKLVKERDEWHATADRNIAKANALKGANTSLLSQNKQMRAALDRLAQWNNGPEVDSSFDDPWAARIAREALSATAHSQAS